MRQSTDIKLRPMLDRDGRTVLAGVLEALRVRVVPTDCRARAVANAERDDLRAAATDSRGCVAPAVFPSLQACSLASLNDVAKFYVFSLPAQHRFRMNADLNCRRLEAKPLRHELDNLLAKRIGVDRRAPGANPRHNDIVRHLATIFALRRQSVARLLRLGRADRRLRPLVVLLSGLLRFTHACRSTGDRRHAQAMLLTDP